jgi:O-antigen ligase
MRSKLPIFISIFALINWDIFYYFVLKNVNFSSGIILLFFVLLGFVPAILNNSFLKFITKKPQLFWVIWVMYSIYIIFNSPYSNNENISFAYICMLICPIVILFLVHSLRDNPYKLINVLIFSYSFHTIIPLVFDTANSLYGGTRLGTIFNSNMIAIGALFCIIIITLKKISFKLNKMDFFYLLVSLIAIILTASRKTTIALILFFLFHSYFNFKISNISKKIRLFMLSIPALIIISFFFTKIEVYKRIETTFNTTLKADESYEMFDGRAIQYEAGYEKFLENPYFGIGLNNYKQFDGYSLVLHSEYLVQFIENGLVGFILFFLFYFSIHKKINKMKSFKFLNEYRNTFIGILLVIYFLYAGSWSFNVFIYWFPIAIVLVFPHILINNQIQKLEK